MKSLMVNHYHHYLKTFTTIQHLIANNLEVLTRELVQFIKDGDTAVQIVPMIKEYLEINVKNDDQLVKMAGIVQRLISAEGKVGSEDEYGLSEEEKTQLLSGMEDTIKDLQLESDNIHNKIESVNKVH